MSRSILESYNYNTELKLQNNNIKLRLRDHGIIINLKFRYFT